MDAKIAADWTNRLTSGKYSQGMGALRDENGRFCCLGVLCEMAVEAGVIPAPTQPVQDGLWSYWGQTAVLPEAVREWAGMGNAWGEFYSDGRTYTLTNMNDSGDSFTDIAEHISKHFDRI